MANIIITKSGTGAPVAGDLENDELAIDNTNNSLYTKIAGTIVKLADAAIAGMSVINTLISTSTTDALSANMGKTLNDKIDVATATTIASGVKANLDIVTDPLKPALYLTNDGSNP